MAEIYPILLNGEKKGKLTVTREGLMTVFDARCEDPGRLLRLSVYGGGAEGYLGVMTPGEGALSLRRRLSRSDMAAFPREIEHAGEASAAGEEAARRARRQSAPLPAPAGAGREGEAEEGAAPPAEEKPTRPARSRGRETDVLWHPVGDGTLYTRRADGAWRAVPLAAGRPPAPGAEEKRTIEGVEYALYRLKEEK